MRALAGSLLLAAAAIVAAYRLFPRVDSLAAEPAAVSRSEAITRARSLASSYGRNVNAWPVSARGIRYEQNYEMLRLTPGHPLAHLTHRYTYIVLFFRIPEVVKVELSGAGAPISFSYTDPRRTEIEGQALTADQVRRLLGDFAGADAVNFRLLDSVNQGSQGHVTTWEWSNEDDPDLIQHLSASSAVDGIRSVGLHGEFSSALQERRLATLGGESLRIIALPILIIAGISLTCALFFAGLARGHIHLRPALKMFAGLLAIWLAGYAACTGMEEAFIESTLENRPPLDRLLSELLMGAAQAALFAAMWAVGRALMRRAGAERWQTWDALLAGIWRRREVGRSVCCGLLLGAALISVPIGLCAAGIFGRSDANLGSPSNLAARVPSLLPFTSLLPTDLSAIFFLLIPLAASPVGRRHVPQWQRWTFVAVLGPALVSMIRNPVLDQAGAHVMGSAMAAAFFLIYWRFDLLAVMMAEVGYSAAMVAVHFLNQDSAALHASGWWIAGVYGSLALAGAVALLAAPTLEKLEERELVEIAPEREILATEFAMAREAQQRLLPRVPARLDGFSLAASCHPAREVGGDLYDFFRFPDGTYGMCVADVSGKGVPAALYMTMTKGILAAASRDPADLPALASALNSQIYAASRKKTFVTMALGRLDVQSRTLDYVRAGHNSILLRRSGGDCEYRQPRGVGLGLTSSRLFERSIEVDSLVLGDGDIVVFYSDGITEAMNSASELFGEERLEAVVRSCSGNAGANELEQAILGEVRGFMGGEPPHDDMTLLVIRA